MRVVVARVLAPLILLAALPGGLAQGDQDALPLQLTDPVEPTVDRALAGPAAPVTGPVLSGTGQATTPLEPVTKPAFGTVDGLAQPVRPLTDLTFGTVSQVAPGSGDQAAPATVRTQATPASEPATAAGVAVASVVAVGAGTAMQARPDLLARIARGAVPMLRALAWVPGLAFFSRIEDDALKDHPIRARILQYLEHHKGATMQELQGASEVAWGTAVYHLGRLERARHVVSLRDGKARRFWLEDDPEARHRRAAALLKNDTPAAIIDVLRKEPGIHQAEVCARLQILPATASKFLHRLEEQGLVQAEEVGRRRHYTAASIPV